MENIHDSDRRFLCFSCPSRRLCSGRVLILGMKTAAGYCCLTQCVAAPVWTDLLCTAGSAERSYNDSTETLLTLLASDNAAAAAPVQVELRQVGTGKICCRVLMMSDQLRLFSEETAQSRNK